MPKTNKLPSSSVKRQLAHKAAWNEARSAELADFFTFGYSGRKIEKIIEALNEHGVRTVVTFAGTPSACIGRR